MAYITHDIIKSKKKKLRMQINRPMGVKTNCDGAN